MSHLHLDKLLRLTESLKEEISAGIFDRLPMRTRRRRIREIKAILDRIAANRQRLPLREAAAAGAILLAAACTSETNNPAKSTPPSPPEFAAPRENPFNLISITGLAAPALADLDGDDDYDLIAGNQDGDFFYFENTGSPTTPAFADPQTNLFNLINVGRVSAPALADLDGDDDYDLIAGNQDGNFVYFENTGSPTTPAFADPQTNLFNLINVGGATAPALADLDDDGNLDLIAGNQDANFFYFENTGSPIAPSFADPQTNHFGLTSLPYREATLTLADLDGDGDYDLIAGEYGGDFFYFENIGTPINAVFADPQTNLFGLARITAGSSHLASVDLDGDRDYDLIAGDLNGNFVYFENTKR